MQVQPYVPVETNRTRTKIITGIAFLYSMTQVGLYIACILYIPCQQARLLFGVALASEVALGLCLSLLLYTLATLSCKVFTVLIGTLTALFKVGVVIYVAVDTQTNLGECYVVQTLNDWLYGVMMAEAALLAMLIVCVEIVRRRVEEVQLMNMSLQKAILQTSA